MLGKHLRKLGSILASLRTPKRTFKANILTLGMMVFAFAFVPICNVYDFPMQRSQMQREDVLSADLKNMYFNCKNKCIQFSQSVIY